MTCIDYDIFDDLLIGNYMKTTLHNVPGLYPNFSPYVAKYGDNGGAKSKQELATYFGHYHMRDPVGRVIKRLSTASEQMLRKTLPAESAMFKLAKRTYYQFAVRR
jgi:hypothetical protein